MKSPLDTPLKYTPGSRDGERYYPGSGYISRERNVDHISALYQDYPDWLLVTTATGLDQYAEWKPRTLVILCVEATHERLTVPWRVTAAMLRYCRRSELEKLLKETGDVIPEGPVPRLRHKQILMSLAVAYERREDVVSVAQDFERIR